MCKKKFIRGSIFCFMLGVFIIATLFCFIVSYSTFVWFSPNHRLIDESDNFCIQAILALGCIFCVSSILSAASFYFTRKQFLSLGSHRVLTIVATSPISTLLIIELLYVIINLVSGTPIYYPIYKVLLVLSLIFYILPFICEYIFVRKKSNTD